MAGAAAQQRRGLIVNDFRTSVYAIPKLLQGTTHTAVMATPLLYGEHLVGVLVISREETGPPFAEADLEALNLFTAHAAIAIENARLYEQIQQHASDLETRVKERTVKLEHALRVKAEFLDRMSHELRTPLNFVLGFSELLKEQLAGPLTAKQERFVDRIQLGGRHLLALVSDLLELSQAETGQDELRLERVLLTPLIREIVDVYAAQAVQKRLQIETECPPALSVVADRRRLSQILGNLVSNAVRFTREGAAIRVTAKQAEYLRSEDGDERGGAGDHSPQLPGTPAPQQSVEIAIEDTGIGLAPGDVERIFLGFEQVDGSSTRRHEGAGIGLALVRTLVALHGGRVWAESPGLGRGSRFVVRLPVLTIPPAQRVLVVEDELAVARPVAILLRDAGFAVEVAATGAEALASLAAQRPDLLVLDLGLPDVDGWEVLKTVRAGAQTRTLPVVVLTGLGAEQVDQAAARGADEFLTKPISPSVLAGVVKSLLTRPRQAALSPERAEVDGGQEEMGETGRAEG